MIAPRLILPELAFAEGYLAALAEGFTDTGRSPLPAAVIAADLPTHLERLNRPRDDGIPFAHLWLVDEAEFIGRVSLRFALDEALRLWGGHIGYAIRPSRWRLGYGHCALALAKQAAAARGLTRVLLTCDDTNAGSIRIIEAGGGVLDYRGADPTQAGRVVRRYWIGLQPTK